MKKYSVRRLKKFSLSTGKVQTLALYPERHKRRREV